MQRGAEMQIIAFRLQLGVTAIDQAPIADHVVLDPVHDKGVGEHAKASLSLLSGITVLNDGTAPVILGIAHLLLVTRGTAQSAGFHHDRAAVAS